MEKFEDSRPFFTIVIPTRNRPHFLKYALESLRQQNFANFEVIVSNNSDDPNPAQELVQSLNDSRFRVVRPDRILRMDDNWNFGLSYANGRFITILSDKAMLLEGALKKIYNDLRKDPEIEVINWMSDWYAFKDEDHGMEGFYQPQQYVYEPIYYDTNKEIQLRLSFSMPREELKRHYFRGQIYYGFFSSQLIERIKDKMGKVFFGLSPDYVAFVLGLLFSKKSYDIGMPLSLMFVSKHSNGNKAGADLNHSIKYVEEYLDEPFDVFIQKLQVPGLYQAISNYIAYDFLNMIEKSEKEELKQYYNKKNLEERILEEIKKRFPDTYNEVLKQSGADYLLDLKPSCWEQLSSITQKYSPIQLASKIKNKCIQVMQLMIFPKNNFHRDVQKQMDAYFSKPCGNPMEGLTYGHQHYKKLTYFNYD